TVLGWVFSPIAWVMGVPWHDSGTIGGLLGTRMVLNEFIAYAQLGPMKATLDPVSFTIATFALCGFANISSVGIQIGGIGALVPDRKHDLARLGFRAMLAGTLANFLAALPVRVFARLGVHTLVVTNAAGGIRRTFRPPTLMLMADHLNLMFRNPLEGAVAEGEQRFPDMSDPYDRALRVLARDFAGHAK